MSKSLFEVLALGVTLLLLAGCANLPSISFRLAGTSGPGLTISFDLRPGTWTNVQPSVVHPK